MFLNEVKKVFDFNAQMRKTMTIQTTPNVCDGAVACHGYRVKIANDTVVMGFWPTKP